MKLIIHIIVLAWLIYIPCWLFADNATDAVEDVTLATLTPWLTTNPDPDNVSRIIHISEKMGYDTSASLEDALENNKNITDLAFTTQDMRYRGMSVEQVSARFSIENIRVSMDFLVLPKKLLRGFTKLIGPYNMACEYEQQRREVSTDQLADVMNAPWNKNPDYLRNTIKALCLPSAPPPVRDPR